MRLNRIMSRKKYEEFYGSPLDQMPRLIADNRIPMSSAQLMKKRLELRNYDYAKLKEDWMDNYFDTGDGALYMPDGSLIVVYDFQALKNMTPRSKLIGRALDLKDLDLKDVNGQTFTKAELEKLIIGKGLTLEQARTHPIWQALARGDNKLANDYAKMIFEDNGYDTAMSIFLDSPSKDQKMRAWYIDGTDDRSDVSGSFNLDYYNSRLVGIASEMQETRWGERQ